MKRALLVLWFSLVLLACRPTLQTGPQSWMGVEVIANGWIPTGSFIEFFCEGRPLRNPLRGIGERGRVTRTRLHFGSCSAVRFEYHQPDRRPYLSRTVFPTHLATLEISVGATTTYTIRENR